MDLETCLYRLHINFCVNRDLHWQVDINIPELNPEMVRKFFYWVTVCLFRLDHILWSTGCLSDRYLNGTCSSHCSFIFRWWKACQGNLAVGIQFCNCFLFLSCYSEFLNQVCVQGSMGKGALAGMPLQLAGTRNILEFMDWGDYGAKGTFIKIGSIGMGLN